MVLSLQRQQPDDMLQIAQSLRQILVDGDRLLDTVNRERRLKIRFSVGMSVEEDDEEMAERGLPIPAVHFISIFPPNGPRENLNIDHFLSFKVVKNRDGYYSVREIIKTCCNRLGAVHHGDAEKDDEIEAGIRDLGKILEGIGLRGAFAVLVIIANVVLEGLNDLRQQID
jgi:hypothetical protein